MKSVQMIPPTIFLLLECWEILTLSHVVKDWAFQHFMLHVTCSNEYAYFEVFGFSMGMKMLTYMCIYCISAMRIAFRAVIWDFPMEYERQQGCVWQADIQRGDF